MAPLLLGAVRDGGLSGGERLREVAELQVGEPGHGVQLGDVRRDGLRAAQVLDRLLRAAQVQERGRALERRFGGHRSLWVRM